MGNRPIAISIREIVDRGQDVRNDVPCNPVKPMTLVDSFLWQEWVRKAYDTRGRGRHSFRPEESPQNESAERTG